MKAPILTLLGLGLLSAVALAAEAVTPLDADGVPLVDHRDKIYGKIRGPGESHDILVFAPAGSKFKAKLKKDKKGGDWPEPTLALIPPGGDPIPYPKGKLDMPASGIYTVRVTAAAGMSGAYLLTLNIKPGGKFEFEGELAAGATTELPFGAMKGAELSWDLDHVGRDVLLAPDGRELSPLKGMALPMTGEYRFRVEGEGRSYRATLVTKTAKPSKRKTWLSPGGYDELELRIQGIDTGEGIRDRVLRDMEIEGYPLKESDLDGSPPVVELRKGKDVIPATDVRFDEDSTVQLQRLFATFDLDGAKTGTWKLAVRNPSGAEEETKFKVIKPSSFDLPSGIRNATEVWWIDFSGDFEQDLDLFNLRGADETVNDRAATAVKAYVIWHLREHFRLDGQTGKVDKDRSVPISFIIEEVSKAGGHIGVDYDRLVIGGKANDEVDGTADNPFLSWGFVPVDLSNQRFDDVGEGVGTACLPIREMNPAGLVNTTASFREAFALDRLDAGDLRYFQSGYSPQTQDEIDRKDEIVHAIDTLGREIAAIAAHHVARAMGLPNSDSQTPGNTLYLSGTPDLFGQFVAEDDLKFTGAEIDILREAVRLTNLPGDSDPLNAYLFDWP